MKNTNKLLALLLVLAMVFALAVPVFADEDTPAMAGKTVILHSNDVHGSIKTDEPRTLDFSGVRGFLVTNVCIVQRSAA